MTINIAINGFGRIGKCLVRSIWEYDLYHKFNLTQINSSISLEELVHQLKYDSVHGFFSKDVKIIDNCLVINDHKIKISKERDINKLQWENNPIVLECTGNFNDKNLATIHINNGAKKVIVSAPCKDADATIVYGVNNHILNQSNKVVSVGSCTTNALAPIVQILHKNFNIINGFMTTIHSYTNDQRVLDGSHKDLRRGRACALSIIPTSTGAAKTIGLILPELDGKLDGSALRVPTPNVSLIDFTFTSIVKTSVSEINEVMREASEKAYSSILSITNEPLVSVDFNHLTYSAIFDSLETKVINNNFCRIVAWYDNEWGFVSRMLDVANLMSSNLN